MLILHRITRPMFHLSAVCLLAFALLGCVTESQKVDPAMDKLSKRDGLPTEVLRIPQQMQDLAGDLLRYHSRVGVLPVSLNKLVHEKILTPDRFAALPDYLYSPTDRYTLRDGRVVILVDAEVRIEGHAWCIVKEPDNNPKTIQLNVTPVALAELDFAATNR